MIKKLRHLFYGYSNHRVYSIGYQGRNIKEFVQLLKKNKIKTLIDTRNSGLSRKPHFSRNALKKAIEKNNMTFIALPDVGAEKEFRKYLKETGNINAFFKMYKKNILEKGSFDKLAKHINGEPVCIMCFEKNPYECHRLILSDLIHQNLNTAVVHL